MRKSLKCLAAFFVANIITLFAFAQTTTISGNVKNNVTGEVVSAASITVRGSGAGTFTDDKGNFTLSTTQKFPVTLVISSVGFEVQEVTVNNSSEFVQVNFAPTSMLGQEVVIAATRTPSRILESPVSVERVSLAAIRNAAAPSYYDILQNLKGVDMTTSSFAFRTPSTRGFNGSGNLRFNQFVDGMDNQAPALNFSVGSIIGLTELDVESMELLPGASSALYGSGGMNGTLLINSKNPFKYQGLSFQVKQGVNHIDQYQRTISPYFDWSLRWAKKITEKFAFKLGAQLVQIKDWQGTDTRNLLRNNVFSSIKPGTRQSDPNYDGVNVFGDEASASLQAFGQAVRAQLVAGGGGAVAGAVDQFLGAGLTPIQIAQQFGANAGLAPFSNLLPFLIPTSGVQGNPYNNVLRSGATASRTGYDERHLVNYNTYNFRVSGGLNYKITDAIEASFLGYFGTGTSVYTGADRYSLKDLKMGQYKLEVRSKNWFLRGYTTQENSGNAYTATTSALFINRAWKSDATWFQQYAGTYGAARLGLIPTAPGVVLSDSIAHATARSVADAGRFLPGTTQFNNAFQSAIKTDINKGGARFADRSNLYHYEGQLNLSDQVKFAETLIGASFRTYVLNSQGTIFADTAGKININESGAYLQLQKKLLNEVLKLTGSIRYDKHENFEGQFTPRVSALIKVKKDNNIRLSYQTAYRFPSTQDQYINLLTGGANRLIGGLPEFNTFFGFDRNPAYTSQSIVAYRANGNPAVLQQATFQTVRPEFMQSYEIGFKGLLTKRFLLDVYYYYSKYEDFIGRTAIGRGKSGDPARAPIDLASPFTTDNLSFVVNSPTPVKSNGYGVGFEWNAVKNYLFSVNASSDKLRDVPAGLVTFFNTPKFRYNVGFANNDFYKGWGFNLAYRWQDDVNWEGTFGSGKVPAYGTFDGVVSYKFKSINSLLKIGATNMFNKYYRTSFGNPEVGGLYYVSFGFNVF